MRGTKLYVIVAAAFMTGAFVASPELRAYASTVANDVICSGCVGTSDLADNAVTSAKIKNGEVKTADLGGNSVTAAKIKDGEVKAAEIATGAVGSDEIASNAVGAEEIAGVSKLIFSVCEVTDTTAFPSGNTKTYFCGLKADNDDSVMATLQTISNNCIILTKASIPVDQVLVSFKNTCSGSAVLGTAVVSIVVYNEEIIVIP